MNFQEDVALVNKAKSGDSEAFEKLYKKYHTSLLCTAQRLTNNSEDAKDAVQLAFIQMHRSLASLQDPKYFRLWMNKIVRGKCIDIFHKNKDVIVDIEESLWAKEYPEEKRTYLPERQMKFVADQDILNTLINELPYDYKEVINYAYFSQFSMIEIADILEIPVGTVKSRLYMAKKALRKKVMEYEKLYLYKLTFHMPGGLTLLLSLGAYREVLKGKGKASLGHSATVVAGYTSFVVAGAVVSYAGYQVYQHYNQNVDTSSLPQNTTSMQEKQSEQDAYFKLLNWAIDATQMKNKTMEDIQEVNEEYELLKASKGPFWESLQDRAWDIAFEEVKNKVNKK